METATTAAAATVDRRERSKSLLSAACTGLHEREEAVKLAFLAAAAGESVFMLGPPGVAKSLVARRLKHCFAGAKSFEYLMGRFSTPEEVFGPISISKLKNEDKYERLVDAYLPGADVAFLDEIWKASPPIQNSLLTAINEKVFRNGERELKMPLKALIAASNELPPEDQGLEALWDRFLVRLYVDNISEEAKFRAMVTDSGDSYGSSVPERLAVSTDEWARWRGAISLVQVPDAVLDIIQEIRKAIAVRNARTVADEAPAQGDSADADTLKPIYVSDRRWKKIVGLLRACAWLDGRDAVDIVDCLLIRHCIWSRDEEREECRTIVERVVKERSYAGMYPIDDVAAEMSGFEGDVMGTLYRDEEYFEPMLRDGCYHFAPMDQNSHPQGRYLQGSRIAKSDYDALDAIVFKDLRITSPNYGDNTIKARFAPDSGIEYEHGNNRYKVPLEGELRTRRVRNGGAKPADRIRWDKQKNALHNEIENILAAVGKHRSAVGAVVSHHAFIDPSDGNLAFENLNAMSAALRKIEVDLDRIGKEYGS